MKKFINKILSKLKINDEPKQEAGLIVSFVAFGTGIWWLSPAASLIICGLIGMLFFYPRGGN